MCLLSRVSDCVFVVWYLSVRKCVFVCLVAVFGGIACEPTNLAYWFLVILRAVLCGLLAVSCSERSVPIIACFLAAFLLPVTELVTIEALPFQSFRFSDICRLWRQLWLSNIFHCSCLMERLRHFILRKLVVLLTSLKKGFYLVGLPSSLLLFMSSGWISFTFSLIP